MIGNDSKKLQVIVSKSEAAAVEKLAEEENRSVSNLVQNIIRKELRKKRSQIKKKKIK